MGPQEKNINFLYKYKIGISIAWVGFFILFSIGWGIYFNNYSLSKGGDFLSGVMSPLAIFWLVLIYRQQQEEMGKLINSQDKLTKINEKELIVKQSTFSPIFEILPEQIHPQIEQIHRNFRVSLEFGMRNKGAYIQKVSLGTSTSCSDLRPPSTWWAGADHRMHLIYVGEIFNNQVNFQIILVDLIERSWVLTICLTVFTSSSGKETKFGKPYLKEMILN